MTTAEATMTMYNQLSEREKLNVQEYIQRIFVWRKSDYDLKPLTEKQFLKKIDKSIDDAKHGRVYTREQSREHIREKYGI